MIFCSHFQEGPTDGSDQANQNLPSDSNHSLHGQVATKDEDDEKYLSDDDGDSDIDIEDEPNETHS